MSADPWAGKFCCQVESLYGDVDVRALDGIGTQWARTCFDADVRPTVRWMAAVGDGFDVRPVTEALATQLGTGELALMDEGFQQAAIADFVRATSMRDAGSPELFDRGVVHVILGARHLRLVYSHLFGDETVFYPKSRRLMLAVGGRPPENLPPLNDRRPLTGGRLVGAAAHVAIRRPKVALDSVRRIVGERARLARATVDGTLTADPDQAFTLAVTVEKVTAPKVPSVLFFCSVLRDLQLPPTVVNHVITDVRGYSSVLTGTGGNAVSHVPFTADWSVETPESCAKAIAVRIRRAEPTVRVAAARVFGLREPRQHAAPVAPTTRVPLVTTMSYYRLPAGQQIYDGNGDPARTVGLQNPDLGVLSFNARDQDGIAHLSVSHRGGLVDKDRLLAALVVSAARVGCKVSWSMPAAEVGVHENGAVVRA